MNETNDIVTSGAWYLEEFFGTFFWLSFKLVFVVCFVFVIVFFAKKAIAYIQQFILDHNENEDNVTWFANVVDDVLLYLSIVISGLIWLYIMWFQSVYVILWATFATWFVFKELFQNVMSGILIMTTKEFAIGDLVEVFVDDTIYYWRIEFITLRYTLLRKPDMTRVVISNKMMTRIPVMTLSAEENVRLKTTCRIYSMHHVQSLFSKIKQEINNLESVTQKDFTFITLDSFDQWYLALSMYFYFDPKAGKLRFRVISEVNQALAWLFNELWISFVYNHMTYTMDAQDWAVHELMDSVWHYSPLLSSQ